VIPFLGIANYFTYQGAIKRTNWNSDIRAIFQKNQYIHHLAVVNTPYEAALYYSNAGNVSNNITKDTESILTTVEYKNKIDFTQYFVKDQIGNYVLFIRR